MAKTCSVKDCTVARWQGTILCQPHETAYAAYARRMSDPLHRSGWAKRRRLPVAAPSAHGLDAAMMATKKEPQAAYSIMIQTGPNAGRKVGRASERSARAYARSETRDGDTADVFSGNDWLARYTGGVECPLPRTSGLGAAMMAAMLRPPSEAEKVDDSAFVARCVATPPAKPSALERAWALVRELRSLHAIGFIDRAAQVESDILRSLDSLVSEERERCSATAHNAVFFCPVDATREEVAVAVRDAIRARR